MASPIGEMAMVITDGALELLDFPDENGRFDAFLARRYPNGAPPRERDTSGIPESLMAYFDGDLGAIDAVPARPHGTPFQQAVWTALRRVPCGTAITYRDLADRAGRPRAIRAAGAANGQNPVSIVIPCHRIIGTDGSLTGYGGGLARKAWLLEHEGAKTAGNLHC
ncbi:MAG: methylated-DNA--[protein]-cysteine S-methyltransferase [Rhodospirillales bacterium]|nr:methylated-DNA--[protein]-cysteine S-methyltransferase [Rhodospirillales bacterium]